ncbi:exosortase [Natronocella acetinitrilica]|uniref:Exosortase n=1 Tax=Natronocella acetinitrilica TaxID=414046 RepID=A0AAE3G7J6_9GAMM|nr:exosortase [Natronocella acetinitrilica]MCP1677139.1 exosortase [Natronocella acetinitrilica]
MSAVASTVQRNLLRPDLTVLIGGFLLVLALHWAPLERLFQRWLRFDEAYSHGLFVFGASLFLLYRVLKHRQFGLQPSVLGIALAAFTALAISLADVVNIQILQQMGAVFLWWAIAVAMLGWRAGWNLAIPIGFLYYAVPMWDYLTKPLVGAAVVVNDILLGFMGIHFRVEGVYIYLLDVGAFEVADGCSGLRYLVVALTLSTLFSALNFSRAREWIILHLVAIAMALLVNWVRIFWIILAGYQTDMQTSLIDDHEMFGWILFAVCLVPFFFIANRLANGSPEPSLGVPAPQPAHAMAKKSITATALLAGLVALPVWLIGGASAAAEQRTLVAPERLGDYVLAPHIEDTLWNPIMQRTDQVLRASYVHPDSSDQRMHLGIWYYNPQRQNHELVQFGNRPINTDDWRVVDQETDRNGWRYVVVHHRYIQEHRIVALGYLVNGDWTQGGLQVKLQMLRTAFSRHNFGALVSLSMVCDTDACRAERELLVAELRHIQEQPFAGK